MYDRASLHHDRVVRWTGYGIVVAGMALTALRLGLSEPGERTDPEALVGSAAFGVAVALPGLLALLARRGRPVLLLPAAVVLVPLSFLSFALVTLPLLVPAVLLFGSYARHRVPGHAWRDAAIAAVLVTGSVGAVAALFTVDSARTYRTGSQTTSTEIISYRETAMSLALVAASLGFGLLASTPVGGRRGGAQPPAGREARARHRER